MDFADDHKMIQTFPSDGGNPAFGVGIKIGRVRRDFHDGDVFGGKKLVKFFIVPDVPVADERGLALFEIED